MCGEGNQLRFHKNAVAALAARPRLTTYLTPLRVPTFCTNNFLLLASTPTDLGLPLPSFSFFDIGSAATQLVYQAKTSLNFCPKQSQPFKLTFEQTS